MDFRVRQKSSDSRGWLRFQGPVLGRPESQIWAGVQWDIDSGKGKHDGEVNGHRYFTCPSGTGSLVKLSKIEFPITLEQALQEKYGETFDGLKYAGLQGSNVGILNVSKEISMLEGVDLSNSLICSWKDILSFLFSMPFLVEIDLSRNILDSSSVSSSEALLNDNGCVTLPLKKLFLNKTTCSTEFLKLALKFGILPELELLHLRGNKLNSESKLPVSFPNLQELDLSYNEIDDMASILPLSKLKT